jgi:DNA-binding FrmR family transcriptional regulator
MKYQSLFNRLRRIEGQIRGIEEMVAKDKPFGEILVQLEAARSSLGSSVVSLIESVLESEDGSVKLSADDVRTIMWILKK